MHISEWLGNTLLDLRDSRQPLFKSHSRTVQKRAAFSRVVGKPRSSPERPVNPPVLDAADSMRTRVSTAFIRMIQAVKESIPEKELAAAIAAQDMTGCIQVLDIANRMARAAKGSGIGTHQTSFQEALKDTYQAGAYAELEHLKKVRVAKAELVDLAGGFSDSIGVKISFDLLSPESISFLESYTLDLIQQISDDSRLSIQNVLLDAFRNGGHPYEQAREIKDVIGLTDTEIKAVGNFQKALMGGPDDLKVALQRGLRDRRFDPTIINAIEQGGMLDADQIQNMTDRYYERYLKYRAEMIARTETIRASVMGQQQTWKQAADQNLLDVATSKQKWIVTHDDRLCDFCASVPRMNEGGVPLGDAFITSWGPVSGPPLHPHCRCALGLVVAD